MSKTIKLRRNTYANIPTLQEGEPFWATDQHKLYVGDGSANHPAVPDTTIAMLGLDADLATFALPANTTISAYGKSLVDDANAAAAIATLGLDADLATLSVPASTTISSFAKTFLDDASGYEVLATLGYSSFDGSHNQTVLGNTTSGGSLTLSSTSNATKGKILFGTSGYDETNNILMVGAQTAVGSSNFQIHDADAGLGILNTTLPGDTSSEAYIAMYAYDDEDGIQKCSSISTKWKDADHDSGYSILRLNSTYMNSGVQADDIQIKMFGGHGMTMFCSNDVAPGSGKLSIGTSDSEDGYVLYINNDAGFKAKANSWDTFACSRKNKTGIKPIGGALGKIDKISGITFKWNDKKYPEMIGLPGTGITAEDLDSLKIPGVVTKVGNEYTGINLTNLIPLLVQAIKELRKEIVEMKGA